MEEIKEQIEKEKVGLELRLFIVNNLPALNEMELHSVTFLMEEIIKTKDCNEQC
ncbi:MULTISPECIES: hypothetical protein [Aquimarina]|uniref:hypothetical protein n=1 Tax=Aquimarina TaxID=290174 RepID=UPI00135C13F8|nr:MULTISPECIES: hypothetical protein [Aquimarina]